MKKYTPGISFFEKTYLWCLRRCQKLAVILENKVVQNLKLEKKIIQKWSPKSIFLNEGKKEKKFVDF